jgi:hypothetical protein
MLLDTCRSLGKNANLQAYWMEMRGLEHSFSIAGPLGKNWKNSWVDELLQFTKFGPDLKDIVEIGSRLGLRLAPRVKIRSARTTFSQAVILAHPRFLFPGHRSRYQAESNPFAVELMKVLQVLGIDRWYFSLELTAH